jgi:hypothetical protein
MLTWGREDEHRPGTRLRNHLLNAAKVQAGGKMIALRVRIEELQVGLNNSNELNIRPIQNSAGWRERTALQKALDMSVHQADNANSHWGTGMSINSRIRVNSEEGEHHKN